MTAKEETLTTPDVLVITTQQPCVRIQDDLMGICKSTRQDPSATCPLCSKCYETHHGSSLQDNNTQPHHAHVAKDFLLQDIVNKMDWPAHSPDLNPIERQ